MSEADLFLKRITVSIDQELEEEVLLNEVANDNEILIGQPDLDVPAEVHVQFPSLPSKKQRLVYANAEIFRGFTVGEGGFTKRTRDIYSFAAGYRPIVSLPEKNTQFLSSFAFSKTMIETRESSSRTTKIELNAPFVSAESEFSREKENKQTSTEITEYLLAKLIFAYAEVVVDPEQLMVSPDFVSDIESALDGQEYSNFYELTQVLERWGYYIPSRFLLGGAVIGREETRVSEFSTAVTESNAFSTSFKLDIKGFGGGPSHGRKDESGRTQTNEHKYVGIQKQMRGGKPALESNLDEWCKSLDDPARWVIASIEDFWPTLELLGRDEARGVRLLGRALKLLDKFADMPDASKATRYLDLRSYATRIQALVNPF